MKEKLWFLTRKHMIPAVRNFLSEPYANGMRLVCFVRKKDAVDAIKENGLEGYEPFCVYFSNKNLF